MLSTYYICLLHILSLARVHTARGQILSVPVRHACLSLAMCALCTCCVDCLSCTCVVYFPPYLFSTLVCDLLSRLRRLASRRAARTLAPQPPCAIGIGLLAPRILILPHFLVT